MPSEVERLVSQIAEVTEKLRLIEERKNYFVDATSIPIDLVNDERQTEERLKDLRMGLKQLGVGDPKLAVVELAKVYVNRDEERRLFREMICGKTPVHILLVEAEKGMGKTKLLKQFLEISENLNLKRAYIDITPSYRMGRILGELRDQYGKHQFPLFHAESRNVLSRFGHNVAHDNLVCEAIDLRLPQSSGDELTASQRLITSAFLNDLNCNREGDGYVVLILDNFQNPSVAVRTWIAEVLIDEIRRYPWLVCVIAGHESPQVDTKESSWGMLQKLRPLPEKHLETYIDIAHYILPETTRKQDVVAYIIKASKGNPYKLYQLVASLLED